MTRRRKKAWGPSNPLWRYLNRKSRPSRGKRRVKHMGRRRYGRRRGRGRGGGSKFFGLGTKGLISLGVMGALAGGLFGDRIGDMLPVVNQQDPLIKSAAGGFVIGGPAGAALAVAKNYFMGGGSSGGGVWY